MWCRAGVVVVSFNAVQCRISVGFSVGLVSFRVVWCRISVVLMPLAQCRISLGLLSNCVGLVSFRVVWCRISVGFVSF